MSVRVFAFAIVLIASSATCEPRIEVRWDGSPFPESSVPGEDLQRGESNLRYESFDWSVGYDWPGLGANHGSLSIFYARRTLDERVEIDRVNLRDLSHWDLYSMGVSFRWAHQVGQGLEWEVGLTPKYETGDDRGFGKDDLKFGAMGVLRRDVSFGTIGMGATWTWLFGRKMLVPLLEVEGGHAGSATSLHILAPQFMYLEQGVRSWIRLGLLVAQQGGDYRTDHLLGRDGQRIRYRSTSIGPRIGLNMRGMDLSVSARFGIEFLRESKTQSPDGTWLRQTLDSSWLSQLSIRYGAGSDRGGLPLTGGLR